MDAVLGVLLAYVPLAWLAFRFKAGARELQAAILDLKIKRVPPWIRCRRELASLYHKRLIDLMQLHLPPSPIDQCPYHDVFQNYEIEAQDRDRLVSPLKARGVEILVPWGRESGPSVQGTRTTSLPSPLH